MKTLRFASAFALATCLLAGCGQSSTPASTDNTNPSQNTTTESNENSSTSANTGAQEVTSLSAQADQIRQAFSDAGFTLSDWEQEGNEISFHALSNNGSVEIDIDQYSSSTVAEQKYNEECGDQEDDGYTLTNSWQNDHTKMSEYNNSINSVYAIETVDTQNNITWSVDDILEGNLSSIYSILSTFGFTK